MSTKRLLALLAPALCVTQLLCQPAPPSAECHAEAVFERVSHLLQSRQYEDAAKALNKLQQCSSLPAIDRFQIGWLYGRARHFHTALKAFDSVPKNVPDLVTHQYAVALSKFELADYRGASEVLKSLQSQSAFDPKCANLLAVSYSKLGSYQDAYAVLAQDIHSHPDDLNAYLNLITVCAESENFAKAAEMATEASRLFPQSSEVFVARGAADTLLGHLAQAREDFTTAAHVAPNAGEPRFFLALTEYKLGKYSDAVAILRSALADGIVDADLQYLMAECLLKLDPTATQKVLEQLNRAIELNSNSISARTLRGRLLLEAGQTKEALVDLELANRLDPTSRSAKYNLARAYRAEGRTDEARSLFNRFRSQTGDTLKELGDKRLNQALSQASAGGQP
ncbi:MAG TPA: tetratricopeptide repeat protein [Bryobacteraceae bacterium]|jgi:tetratricopeptide (TPR) repeat protein